MAASRVQPEGFCEELAGWMAVMDSADRELAGGRVRVGRVGSWGRPRRGEGSETSEKPAWERDHALRGPTRSGNAEAKS